MNQGQSPQPNLEEIASKGVSYGSHSLVILYYFSFQESNRPKKTRHVITGSIYIDTESSYILDGPLLFIFPLRHMRVLAGHTQSLMYSFKVF
jgi:hypothetical protein